MERDEFIRHWNSFCNLTNQLEETQKYVFHGLEQGTKNEDCQLEHGKVYSDVFRQILIVACAEFENMGKALGKMNGDYCNNIVDISKSVLGNYPHIISTKVYTEFWALKPLQDWKVVLDSDSSNQEKIVGIDWWRAYNSIKHDEANSFKRATLDNAVMALASLYILDLYIMKISSGSLRTANDFPPRYFRCEYTANYVVTSEIELPGMENK